MLVASTIDAPTDRSKMQDHVRCLVKVMCSASTDNLKSGLFEHRLGDTLGDSSVNSSTMHPIALHGT